MLDKTQPVGSCGNTQSDIWSIKRELNDWLFVELDGVVQSGPFKGMVLPRESAWKETHLAPLLLGCYEEELHGLIDQQINRMKDWDRAPNIVVVGAAEGYYAIGMKRRLPKANVYAIEPSNESLSILKAAAAANDTDIIVGASLGEVFAAPDLVLMDCEGAEVEYLDYEKFPALANAHVIVEIHNLPNQKTDDILLNRFRGTHRMVMYMEGPRDPNRYPSLFGTISDYRWLAVSEGRPCLMSWFSMTPKGVLQS